MSQRLALEVELEAIEMYKAGEPLKAITAKFGFTESTVKLIRERHGVGPRQRVPVNKFIAPPGTDEKIIHLYIHTMLFLSAIARECGVSKAYVEKLVARTKGIPRRNGAPRVPPQITKEIEEAYCDKGESVASLAKRFNLSNNTVRRVLRDVDVTWDPRPGDLLTQEQRDRMVERYVTGEESCVEVARAFGVNDRMLFRELKRRGLNGCRVKRLTSEERERMVELYNQFWPCRKIADHLNRTVDTVYGTLRARGIEIRPQWEYKRRRKQMMQRETQNVAA